MAALQQGALRALLLIWAASACQVLAQRSSSLDPFSEDPLRPSGQNVIPVYDGWFPNADGSFTLCFGYFNMNTEQALEVPLGPGNRLEPAIYDGVQPTHFDPVPAPTLTSPFRHHWCVFSVIVPADFGSQDLTWSLQTQGNTLSVPGSLRPAYILDEEVTFGRGAVAPYLSLNDNPPNFRGRRGLWEGPRVARVGEPLQITARVNHPETGTWLGWTKHQGPGAVEFSQDEVRVNSPEAAAVVTAIFREAGSYVLRVQAINDTEQRSNPTYGFEFHCCWTNGYLRVDVIE